MKQIASPGLMHDTGCLVLVHWDNPEGWYREGGRRGLSMGNACTPVADSCWCVAKPIQYCKVINLQLKWVNFFFLKRVNWEAKANRTQYMQLFTLRHTEQSWDTSDLKTAFSCPTYHFIMIHSHTLSKQHFIH